MHENAYSSIYIFKIFSGGDTPGPPLTRGGEGTGGRGGEWSGGEGKGRGEERRRGGREGKEGRGKEGGRGGEGKKGQGGAFPYFFFYKSSTEIVKQEAAHSALWQVYNCTRSVSNSFPLSSTTKKLLRGFRFSGGIYKTNLEVAVQHATQEHSLAALGMSPSNVKLIFHKQ
jgi:hypothetical protein